MKKSLFLLLLTFFIAPAIFSQFYMSVLPSPEFTSALEKIVVDFRVNFKTIEGNEIMTEGEMQSYESMVKLPGARQCTIYKFNSGLDTSASWQAVMYSGDVYSEAVKTYENIFRLVKKSRIKWIDRSVIGFAGELEKPSNDVGFSVSTLHLQLDDYRYKNFLAEIELVSGQYGWQVNLNLYSKKDDAEQ